MRVNEGNAISDGIARLYWETGLPLAAAAKHCRQAGREVSWLNVVRQFQRQGFSDERIISEFREMSQFEPVDVEMVEQFIAADYDTQCDMLWDFWKGRVTFEWK